LINSTTEVYGNISDVETRKANLTESCIPEVVFGFDFTDYETFLAERRKLMAQKIRSSYYKSSYIESLTNLLI